MHCEESVFYDSNNYIGSILKQDPKDLKGSSKILKYHQ